MRRATRPRTHRSRDGRSRNGRRGDAVLSGWKAGRRAGCALALALLGAAPGAGQILSPGDRVELDVLHDDYFDGKYQLSQDGMLVLRHGPEARLAGLEVAAARERLQHLFEMQEIYRSGQGAVSIRVLSWAPITVNVQGEVFYPGQVTVHRPTDDSALRLSEELPGGDLPRRRLADALKAAGGVTPWADLRHVEVHRGEDIRLHDLSGVLENGLVEPVPLVHGDRVYVRRVGDEMQPLLARASAVTMPGIKIHVSNLVVPAQHNAAAALDPSIGLPYGSRLSHAVVAGNCAGGAATTNSRRHVWWVRTDKRSGTTETLDVSIREVLLSGDGKNNPILFEGDAVVCFDSKVTNLREIFRTLGEMFLPFLLYREAGL